MKELIQNTLPIQGSDVAIQWDDLYHNLNYILIFFFVLVIGAMAIFMVKYRARPGHKSEYIAHHTGLEILWTVVPTILVIGIFIWGWIVYAKMIHVAENSMEVRVVAQRWSWTFQYDDGKTFTNQVVVPVNKPVKLTITSKKDDVLHSLFIPSLRTKKDAVPGMYTTLTFTPSLVGQHQIFCAEYCGTSHSMMLAKLVVLDADQWKRWQKGELKESEFPPSVGVGSVGMVTAEVSEVLGAADAGTLVEQGKKLYESKGCFACHSIDGSPKIGPSWKGVWGSEREMADGSKVIADANYIRESIENPELKKVKGFETMVMVPYPGQLTESDFSALLAFMQSLK